MTIQKNNKYDHETTEGYRQRVVQYLVRGNNMEEIAEKLNVDTDFVVKTWKDYVSSQYAMPEDERWLLHEQRLEYMLRKATNLIEEGLDSEFGAQTLQAALKVLQQLEELQGLNNARKKEAENKAVQMTQQQVAQMLEIMDAVKLAISTSLPKEIQVQTKNYWTPHVIQGLLRETIRGYGVSWRIICSCRWHLSN